MAILYTLKVTRIHHNGFLSGGIEGPNPVLRALPTIALFLLCHLFFSVIARSATTHAAQSNQHPGILLANSVSLAFSVLCFAILFTGLHKINLCVLVSQRSRFRFGHFAISFFPYLTLIGISTVFLPSDWREGPDLSRGVTWWSMSILLIHTTLLASLEELLFRSYLPKVLSSALNTQWLAILFTSLVFALVHLPGKQMKSTGDWWTMGYLIAIGFFLCLLAEASSGIEFGLGIHTANNFGWLALNGVGLTSGPTTELPDVGPWSIISPFVAIFILIFYSRRKRDEIQI